MLAKQLTKFTIILTILIGSADFRLQADEFTGKVVGVSDGDTITVLRRGRGEKVRLFGIDAPEQGQPFHARSKEYLSTLIYQKNVVVKQNGEAPRDQYKRIIAEVFVDGMSVNYLLLRNGLAWWYRHFAPHEKKFQEGEKLARRERLGLWKNNNPTPPWAFRKKSKKG